MSNVAQSSCLELNDLVFHRICPGLHVYIKVVRSRCKGRDIHHGYLALRSRALRYQHIYTMSTAESASILLKWTQLAKS